MAKRAIILRLKKPGYRYARSNVAYGPRPEKSAHHVEPFAFMAALPAQGLGDRCPGEKIEAVIRSARWELPASEARTDIQAIATELKLST